MVGLKRVLMLCLVLLTTWFWGCKAKRSSSELRVSGTEENKTTGFQCENCHQEVQDYFTGGSLHEDKGLQCGQCHQIYPDTSFGESRPFHMDPQKHVVTDKTCGGCHNEQYQQILSSKLYEAGIKLDIDSLINNLKRKEARKGDGKGLRYQVDGKLTQGMMCISCHFEEKVNGAVKGHMFRALSEHLQGNFYYENRNFKEIEVHYSESMGRGHKQKVLNHNFPADVIRSTIQ